MNSGNGINRNSEASYALITSNLKGIPNGSVSKDQFEHVVERRADAKIFVLDSGEFQCNAVGRVIVRQPDGEFHQTHLAPIPYRILVHTLRNNGVAGTYEQIADVCWRDRKLLKNLNKANKIGDKDLYQEEANKIRTSIRRLNKALDLMREQHLKSRRTGTFQIKPLPLFMSAEILEKNE